MFTSASFFHFAVAAIPVAIYLVLIGSLRLRTRPLVTTGWRDALTVGIAASGLVAIGPMQLFFPVTAGQTFRGWVWLALFTLYLLALILVLLSCKPRLIAYGLSEKQFREVLLTAAKEVDDSANWEGEVLSLPQVGIQVASDPTGAHQVEQVVHIGMLHNFQDWVRLERSFASASRKVTCPRVWIGWLFVIVGLGLLAFAVTPLVSNPDSALAHLQDFLNR